MSKDIVRIPKRRSNESVVDHFWKHCKREGECLVWQGAKDEKGYGQFNAGGKNMRTSRFAWFVTYGPVPIGCHVLHKCDNPPCVEPTHLWLGNNRQNAIDRELKGRGRNSKGEYSGNNKLTNKQVLEIRDIYAKGAMSQQKIADLYNVSQAAISTIVLRQTWWHI